MKRFWLVVVLAVLTVVSPCLAETPKRGDGDKIEKAVPVEGFTAANIQNLTKTLIRYGAVNVYYDEVIDAFMQVTECSLYQQFYRDDFKWQKIRDAARQKIRQEIAVYPTTYVFDTTLRLGRYDFKKNFFAFSDNTLVRNVNAFTIYSLQDFRCGDVNLTSLPVNYRVVLDHPLYIDGLPLSEVDSKTLLKRMDDAGNPTRILFVRFKLRVTYIAPMEKEAGEKYYAQKGSNNAQRTVRMDGRLDSVDFFEDPEMTRLIYTYRDAGF